MVGRGLHEIVGWSFTEPGAARPAAPARRARAAARRAAGEPAVGRRSRSCARRCSARCSTPRATTSRATAPTWRSSSPGTVYRADRPARRTAPCRRSEHHALGVLLSGALAPALLGRGEPPQADFFAAKALLEALLDALARAVVGRAARRWPFLHPGRSADGARRASDRRRAVRWLRRRGAPAGRRARGTSSARPRSRSTSASSPRVAPETIALRALRLGPVAAPGHRGRAAATTSARARCSQRVREAGGATARRRRRCSTSTPARRSGRAGARSRSRCPSARRSARSPTRTSRRCARRSSRRSPSSGVSCVAEPTASRARVGEARAASRRLAARARRRRDAASPARSPRTCCGAIPRFELVAVTGRSEVGQPPGRPLSALPRAADDRASSISTRSASSTRRSSPTRTPRRRRRSRALRERGVRVVDLSADFRLLLAADLRALVRRAPAPGAARGSRLRADGAAPRADRRREHRREPRLLPDGVAARPRAARARRADRRRGDRRQAGHLGRRARRSTRRRTCRWPARTSSRTRSPNTATRRRSRSSLRRCARPAARATSSRCCSRRTSCRSTRASWPTAT